jgi:hypothetical protein
MLCNPGHSLLLGGGARLALRLFGFSAVAFVSIIASGSATFSAYVVSQSSCLSFPPADAIVVLAGMHVWLDVADHLLKAGEGRGCLSAARIQAPTPLRCAEATSGERALFSCCVVIDHATLSTVSNA